jgi:hypothetical protein
MADSSIEPELMLPTPDISVRFVGANTSRSGKTRAAPAVLFAA